MFTIDGKNNVKPSPEYLLIPEFAAIWKADLAVHKKNAMKEFGYVYMVADPRSPFRLQYTGKELRKQVVEQILQLKTYREPKRVTNAINLYNKLIASKEYLLFKVAEALVHRCYADLERYLTQEADLTPDDVSRVAKLMRELPAAVNGYRAAKKAVFEDLNGTVGDKKSKIVSRWEKPVDDGSFDLEGVL